MLERVSAQRLLSLSVGAAVLCYAGMAITDTVWIHVVLQGFHGLQFGLFWAVVVHLLARWTPPDRRRSGQSLLYAVTFGIAPVTGLACTSLWLGWGGSLQAWFGALSLPAVVATALAWRLESRSPT